MLENAQAEAAEVEEDAAMEVESPDTIAANLANAGIPKNFRQQADIEAFYRFVQENDLREEALGILDEARQLKKAAKTAKAKIKH